MVGVSCGYAGDLLHCSRMSKRPRTTVGPWAEIGIDRNREVSIYYMPRIKNDNLIGSRSGFRCLSPVPGLLIYQDEAARGGRRSDDGICPRTRRPSDPVEEEVEDP